MTVKVNNAIVLSLLAATVLVVTTRCSWIFHAQAFKLGAPSSLSRHYPHRYQYPSQPVTSSSCTSPATASMPLHQLKLKRCPKTSLFHLPPTVESASVAVRNEAASETASGEESDSPPRRNNNRDELFLHRLAELRSFRSCHGHGSIPTSYPDNPSLGDWAANLRRQDAMRTRAERDGRPYTGYLTPSRRSLLRDAGFDFTSLTERQFLNRVEELEDFRRRFGHCMVPEKWEENAALGAWVSNLRSLYRRQKALQKRRQDDVCRNTAVDRNDTLKHGRRRKSRNILKQYTFPIRAKRRLPRFSHLDDERITLFEDMGFVWSSSDRKWRIMLEWAKVYGVVNYRLRENSCLEHAELNHNVEHDVGDYDALPAEGGGCDDSHFTLHKEENGTLERCNNSNSSSTTILIENYRKFVHNIQHKSLLPSFYPQDKILALLLEDDTASAPKIFDNVTLDHESLYQPPLSLDYRIPPNDTLHRSLRIWMVNQRSNYNRLPPPSTIKQSSMSSVMTPERQRALEEIHFPWSGRFPNRMEEVQHRLDIEQQKERQREEERRKELKKRKNKEKVERLIAVEAVEADINLMALWNEEDEDDDNW